MERTRYIVLVNGAKACQVNKSVFIHLFCKTDRFCIITLLLFSRLDKSCSNAASDDYSSNSSCYVQYEYCTIV